MVDPSKREGDDPSSQPANQLGLGRVDLARMTLGDLTQMRELVDILRSALTPPV